MKGTANKTRIPVKDRLMKHVKICPLGHCWVWVGAWKGQGYAAIKINGKSCRAHRVSFEVHKGKIPHGKMILHKCDNRKCINPDHLETGTQVINMKQMIERGRRETMKYYRTNEQNAQAVNI